MRADKDAFGHEIYATFKKMSASDAFKEGVCEIVERDDGFFDAYSNKIYFSKFKEWPKNEKAAIKFTKGKVLDIGCGPGRHSLYLQKRGFDVTSIDSSPLTIKVCRLRGLKKAVVMPINKIERLGPNQFDTILLLGFNGFGIVGSKDVARRLFRKMHKITSPNAIIITNGLDPYDTKNPNNLSYHRFNKKRKRMAGQTRLRILFGKHKSNWFDWLLVNKKEMKMILENTGWKVKKFIKKPKDPYYAAIICKV